MTSYLQVVCFCPTDTAGQKMHEPACPALSRPFLENDPPGCLTCKDLLALDAKLACWRAEWRMFQESLEEIKKLVREARSEGELRGLASIDRVRTAAKCAVWWRGEIAAGRVLATREIEYLLGDLERAGGIR